MIRRQFWWWWRGLRWWLRNRIIAVICLWIDFKFLRLFLTGLIVWLINIRIIFRSWKVFFFGRWCESRFYVCSMILNLTENRMSCKSRRLMLRTYSWRDLSLLIVREWRIWRIFLHFDFIKYSLATYFDEL